MTIDQDRILNTVTAMTNAFSAGNITKVMKAYEEQATVVFEPGVAVSDREQIIQRFEEVSLLKPQFSYSGHEVIIAGDTAMHIAPWTMEAKAPDGSTISDSGLSVAVLKRQHDGEWLMVIDNPHAQFLLK